MQIINGLYYVNQVKVKYRKAEKNAKICFGVSMKFMHDPLNEIIKKKTIWNYMKTKTELENDEPDWVEKKGKNPQSILFALERLMRFMEAELWKNIKKISHDRRKNKK